MLSELIHKLVIRQGTHIVVGPSECARILAIETLAGKSHWNVMNSVLRVLVDHGHNVTVFTSFVEGDRDNYTEIDLSNVILPIIDLEYSIVLKILHQVSTYMPMIMDVTRYNCYATYTHKRMQDILAKGNDTEFDLVITEPLASECVSYVAAKLNRPLIYIVPSTQITFIEWEIFGYMSNPAVNSHLMADHAFPKTFMQRLENTILTLYSSYLLKLSEYQMKTQSKQFYDEIDPAKCSLIFSNTHLINESPRSNFANFIQIGGIHLQSPKLLPKDVLEFIEDSPHGVIYFSFGTIIAMSSLPNNTLNIFKEVLSQIPQRVLWKYESEMKDKPVNIMTKTFFPQRDILLHPKVKLFISHGGISGIHETADAGVPVLGFPLFFDQSKNMETLVEAGMAISMDFFTMKKQDLKDAIIKLINNLKVYTTNENFKKILSIDKCTNNIKAQNSYKIQAVTNIMYQLSVLNALYDPRAMHIALIKILITHRFITMADFMHYKDEFVNYIQTAFPGEISETMKSSFQKFLINYGKALISHKMLLDRLGYEIDENFVINENKHFKIDPQNGLKAELFTDENDELAETINEENIEKYEQCSQN
ncbi:UDP-glucosyltransferase 2-like isoform X2 [Daktulosphaira vitifoliae]|uniref:UDP-glucosyltransferase 2-like isoform X2 n=1 Tax=Daktulosphaira vitifoliae TaxID=58002 RepID=UPI0021AA5649|nr:UDP-glucosyltransferase 2-like isoform X2 [Daktulosphaira vitifoliae]